MFATIVDTVILNCLLAIVLSIEKYSSCISLYLLPLAPSFSSFVADVAVAATADVGSMVIKDVIADVSVDAGAV